MFQFPSYASRLGRDTPVNRSGLPHSDIRGSTLLCSSPQLFAAWHVLHRLCMPRHPPYALFYFFLAWLAQSLHNPHKHELDFVTSFDTLNLKESLLTGYPRITAREASISSYLNTSKNSPPRATPKAKQEDCRGIDPLPGPIPNLSGHRTSYINMLKNHPATAPASKTRRGSSGATGIRTLDPCLAKAVL